ncbi:MAG: 23S rRNA (adenine(2503)-C(2))-methyltransferase RlmN [Spirochaetales bacterium]
MNLYGRTLDELTAFAEEQGLRRYRATQIAEWLYHHHASEINEMSNLPQELRERWQKEHSIGAPLPENAGKSSDGTRKYTWPAFGGDIYEAALIPADERLTLCVSSQAGCRIGCKFCLTAKKGLKQNLSAAEILGQYRNLPERERVTHFVYMGMGEPLRITVSSVGILPDFERLLDETEVNVAVSLHAAKREDRLPLVPSENRYPIATIVELLKHRASLALPPFTGSGRRKFSFEVTMLRGVTDRPEQAVALRNLIQGVPARVNLIPWNSFPGTSFEPSLREDIERYQGILRKAGITATIRESRGEDIGAACGLLAGKRAQAAGATQ